MRPDGDAPTAWPSSRKRSPRCPPYTAGCAGPSAASSPPPPIVGVPESVIRQNLSDGLPMMEQMEDRVIREARRWLG